MLNLPKISTPREIQRNYRKLFDYVKRTRRPLVVMNRNKPEVAIIDIRKLEELEAISSILKSWKEARLGKAKTLTSLVDLWYEAKRN